MVSQDKNLNELLFHSSTSDDMKHSKRLLIEVLFGGHLVELFRPGRTQGVSVFERA